MRKLPLGNTIRGPLGKKRRKTVRQSEYFRITVFAQVNTAVVSLIAIGMEDLSAQPPILQPVFTEITVHPASAILTQTIANPAPSAGAGVTVKASTVPVLILATDFGSIVLAQPLSAIMVLKIENIPVVETAGESILNFVVTNPKVTITPIIQSAVLTLNSDFISSGVSIVAVPSTAMLQLFTDANWKLRVVPEEAKLFLMVESTLQSNSATPLSAVLNLSVSGQQVFVGSVFEAQSAVLTLLSSQVLPVKLRSFGYKARWLRRNKVR